MVRPSARRESAWGDLVTTAPPSTSPWPARYLETLWTLKWAPNSSGRARRGVAVIDRCNEVLSGSEPERAMADGFDLVVHSLDGAIGHTGLGPAQNPLEMPTQHAHEFLEGLQPGAHGRTHPFLQVFAGPLGLLVIPEQLKSFFEVVGADDRRVPPHQRRQAFFLVVAEIPRILQQ